jgi:hypothetical protein
MPGGEVFPEAGPAGFLDRLPQWRQTGEAVSVDDAPLDWWEPGSPPLLHDLLAPAPAERAADPGAHPPGRPPPRWPPAPGPRRSRPSAPATCRGPGSPRRGCAAWSTWPRRSPRSRTWTPCCTWSPGRRRGLLGSDMASLFLLDERGDVLVGRAHVGMDDEVVPGMRSSWPSGQRWPRWLAPASPAVHDPRRPAAGPEQPLHRAVRDPLLPVAVRLGSASRPARRAVRQPTPARRHRFTRPELAFVETPDQLPERHHRSAPGWSACSAMRSPRSRRRCCPVLFPTVARPRRRRPVPLGQRGGAGRRRLLRPVRARGRAGSRASSGRLRQGGGGRPGTPSGSATSCAPCSRRAAPGRALTAFNRQGPGGVRRGRVRHPAAAGPRPGDRADGWSSAGHPRRCSPGPTRGPWPSPGRCRWAVRRRHLPDGPFTLPAGRCCRALHRRVVEARNPDGQELGTEGWRRPSRPCGQRRRRGRGRAQAGPQPHRRPPRRRRRRPGPAPRAGLGHGALGPAAAPGRGQAVDEVAGRGAEGVHQHVVDVGPADPGNATWDSSISVESTNPVPTVRHNRSNAGRQQRQQEAEGMNSTTLPAAPARVARTRSPSRRLTDQVPDRAPAGAASCCGSGPKSDRSGPGPG